MTKNKAREIGKVVVASALAIGIFSVSLIGINQWAFARAVDQTYSFPLTTAAGEVMQNEQSEEFVAPDFTVSASPWQRYQAEIPTQALSMEEAAEIGAEYLWDVFGICLEGMHVEMMFSNWETASRSYWQGSVYSSEEAALALHAHNEAMGEALRNNPYVDLSEFRESQPELPSIHFMIDAITGMRIDVSVENMSGTPRILTDEEFEILINSRQFIDEWQSWFDKSIDEQIAYLGLSDETLEAYMQVARELAAGHFNNSEVVDVQITSQWGGGLSVQMNFGENGERTFVLETINATVTDDTGREAIVSFPAESASFTTAVAVRTQHNDFVPFEFEPTEDRVEPVEGEGRPVLRAIG